MSFYGIRTVVGSSAQLEACLDSRASEVNQATLELNQRVSELFDELRGSVYRYLIVVMGSPAEAEEICQEVFLEFFRYLQKTPGSRWDFPYPWHPIEKLRE